MTEEKITATRKIFKGHIVTLDVHEVRLPDGKTGRRELVDHPGAVAIIALDDQQQVLLVRQYRIGAAAVLYEIPAGTLEPGEDPLVCATRELQEETGYKPGHLEPLGSFYTAPGYTTERIAVYLATRLTESVLPADHDEFIEVHPTPFARALEMIENGEIIDGKTLIGLLRVARRLGL